MFSDSPPSSVLIQESVDTTPPSACLTLSHVVEERPDAYGPLGSLGYAFVWAIRDRKVSLYQTGRAADAASGPRGVAAGDDLICVSEEICEVEGGPVVSSQEFCCHWTRALLPQRAMPEAKSQVDQREFDAARWAGQAAPNSRERRRSS